jgi:crotonobetainyl-CoA:carnitine CoA-transferase CaiB-like acyl-CoA transferase
VAEPDTILGGSRVLDLTEGGQMLCGKLLGDLGADVIKVEPPGGSPSRNQPPFYHDIADPEKSLEWLYLGLNKRGITLDLETAAGRDVLKRLAATADFVVESFEPGYMDRLGLGYRDLERLNPGVVVCSITPFGQTGPYTGYKTPDLVGVSLGGMVRLFGELDGPPTRISAPVFHYLGALHGALGSMMAHYHREFTGEGQHVDVSCQQAVLLTLRVSAETWDLLGVNSRGAGPYRVLPRPDMGDTIRMPLVFPCKDGHVVAMIHGGQQAGAVKSSRALVALANRDGMALELKDYAWEDMDLATITLEEIDGIYESLGRFLLTKTKAELLDAAVADEILMIPVNTAEDVVASPQLAFREYWKRVVHPELEDTLSYPGWPVHWTDMPAYEPQRRAPLVGEHNAEVYGELGLSDAEMASLREQGVV